AFK
ncbi:matE family protein, partial [Vibrio parahaemolyticus V-223/04]